MKRQQHIVVRTASITADITKPRLLDSNGKRKSNNKIAIFSNKYNNLMSTHSLPEGSHETNTQNTTFLKTQSDFASTQVYDSNSHRFSSELKKTQDCQSVLPQISSQSLFAIMRDEINKIKSQYEAKMKQMFDCNARIICQLRQMLTEQQRKVAQKQLLIQKILAQRLPHSSSKKIILNAQAKNNTKLKESQFSYLKSKIHEIDIKVMVLIEAMSNSQRQTSTKLSQLQQKLIRNTGKRLANCKNNLEIIISQFARKIITIEQILSTQPAQPKVPSCQNINLDFMKQGILELQKKITNFLNKQWKYESAQMLKLQKLLHSLYEKVKDSKVQVARKDDYYFQDQDEFFYPSTQRVYQSSDDYEHFQQDSQDEGYKKQNRSPNYRVGSKKES